ncbi:Vta1/callose synthase N-terminal domain-containing protein [Plasmodiophora brassicae]
MATAVPESLKSVKRFLVQAVQLDKSKQPVVAYYARMFALTMALKLPKDQRDAAATAYINSMFDALEKTKATLTLDAERDKQTIEAFAAQVFDYADKADRAGNANKNTVFGFQASSVIFETLQYFGPLDPEVEERIRYAKWKAADIAKALKNGVKPTPGPYNAEPEDVSDAKVVEMSPPARSAPPAASRSFDFDDDDQPSKPAHVQPALSGQPEPVAAHRPPPSYSQTQRQTAASSIGSQSIESQKAYFALIGEAEKKTSQALASLRFKDWSGAETLLLEVLDRVRALQKL